MTKYFFLLCAGILLILRGNAQQNLGFVLEEGKKKVQIPFELQNNLVIVPVVLNGMLPLKFVVDTGVQTGILTQKSFSDILNLQYSRKYSIAGPGGEKLVEAYVTNNVTLDLPGVHGTGHALLVLDQDYLELRNYLGTDVHGILGYELFSRFIVELNYDKKVMTVRTPSRFHPSRRFDCIQISVEDTKPYVISEVVMKNGTKLNAKLMMDSGASHGILLEPMSSQLIQVPEERISSQIGRGIGGEIMGKVGRLESIQIGRYVLENPISNFPDPNSYMDSLKLGRTQRNGTIGGEILSRFTVIFDFSKEQVFLRKGHSFKKKFHYNLSGLIIKALGSDLSTFEVTEVRDQSAADKADVKSGDIILSVNGTSTQSLNLGRLLGYFNSKPGKRIHLELKREGKLLKKTFLLEDQI